MPRPDLDRGRHALARAVPGETCLAQGCAKGEMPWPRLGHGRHAAAKAGPAETCPGQDCAKGDIDEKDQRNLVLVRRPAAELSPPRRMPHSTRGKTVANQWQISGKSVANQWQISGKLAIIVFPRIRRIRNPIGSLGYYSPCHALCAETQ